MSRHEKVGFERRWYTRLMDRYRWSSIYIPFFNPAARTGLRIRSAIDRARVRSLCRGHDEEIEQWFAGLNLFFGFSSVRAGTVFLTNLLKLNVPNSHIEHEANVLDYWELPRVRGDKHRAFSYLEDYRRDEIYVRAPRDIRVYGEINPFLRLHCEAVKTIFPKARLFHLVRDPRDVVRSIMQREILSRKDPMALYIKPPDGDPYQEKWSGMNRFERICWEWQSDNRYIRKRISYLLRFEDMTQDYPAFKRDLLDYLGLNVDEATWSAYVNRPKNASRKSSFPHWTEWDQRTTHSFKNICGEEMAQYGYDW